MTISKDLWDKFIAAINSANTKEFSLLLLRNPLAATQTTLNGKALIMEVIVKDRIDMLILLIAFKASIGKNAFGVTPLHYAAIAGNREIFDLLIQEYKLDPDEETSEGKSVLYWAGLGKQADMLSHIITRYQVQLTSSDNFVVDDVLLEKSLL